MKFCEICKKEESKWSKGFIFVYHIKDDDNEYYYCPDCTYKRLKELTNKESNTK
jgi:DNA-directed RNA polymerase subunit RPC12/RpoP